MDVEAPANVLLLGPSDDPWADETCVDLSTPTSRDAEDVLWVTLTQSPDDTLARYRRYEGALPARGAIIDAGDTTRSASAPTPTTSREADAAVSVDVVSSPGNLTELGVAITNALSEWSNDGNQTVVCLHSITAMLQYSDVTKVFQFLHVVTQLVRSENAIAHYHMDPTAHDEQTINTIKTLFDEVVEPEDETDRSGSGSSEQSDGDHEVYRTRYDRGEPPSQAIVRAIAAIEGVAPEELDSFLYEWVEPDALDSILSQSTGTNTGSIRVEFEFGAYLVTAETETVTVRPTEPSER